jgi:hypothetical protein
MHISSTELERFCFFFTAGLTIPIFFFLCRLFALKNFVVEDIEIEAFSNPR